jgi:hypothetical protein
MSESHISQGDLRAAVEDVKAYIRERDDAADQRNIERLGGVNSRLDKINGNIARHEREIAAGREAQAAADVRTKNLEREVFARQRVATQAAPAADDDKPALTKRDVKRALAGLATVGVLVEALHRIGDLAIALLRHR